MMLRYTVLASGSRGNAALLQTESYGLLIDAGLPARELSSRLENVGLSMDHIHAALLTHTHTDHWNDGIFGFMARNALPLYCHPSHHSYLANASTNFARLQEQDLILAYAPGQTLALTPGLRLRALPVRHDGVGQTFAFRIDGPTDLFGEGVSIGHVSDLGTWDDDLVRALANIDLLAVEFNHDREMELRSTRPERLIARVLGDFGHLSNDQATGFVRAILEQSRPGRLRHLIQLHLSEDCNRPQRAREAIRPLAQNQPTRLQVHTACQDKPGRTLRVMTCGSDSRVDEQRVRV
ncbi:MAG: MBL fold metallo-hydrolase [Gemmataceae bacterium]